VLALGLEGDDGLERRFLWWERKKNYEEKGGEGGVRRTEEGRTRVAGVVEVGTEVVVGTEVDEVELGEEMNVAGS